MLRCFRQNLRATLRPIPLSPPRTAVANRSAGCSPSPGRTSPARAPRPSPRHRRGTAAAGTPRRSFARRAPTTRERRLGSRPPRAHGRLRGARTAREDRRQRANAVGACAQEAADSTLPRGANPLRPAVRASITECGGLDSARRGGPPRSRRPIADRSCARGLPSGPCCRTR